MEKQTRLYQCCHAIFFLVFLTRLKYTSAKSCAVMTSAAGSGVECSHLRMTRFPAQVPDDIRWLNMSFNFLTSLDALNNPRFSRIEHLLVSYNSLTTLSDNVFRTMPDLKTLDLGYNELGALQDSVFNGLTSLTTLVLSTNRLRSVSDSGFRELPHLLSLDLGNNLLSSVPTVALQEVSGLQRLDLSINSLTTIHNHSLSFLTNLQYLSFYCNRLTSVQPGAFVGLEKLLVLDLSHNQLAVEFAYPSQVFTPLVSLQFLNLCDNGREYHGRYPLKVFDPLHSLKTLHISSFDVPHFGAAFANVRALTTLNLNLGCHIESLVNDTFTAFQHSALQTLSIQFCDRLYHIDLCAFCDLPHLSSLSVGYTFYLKLSSLLLAFYGVQNQTLEEVDLSSTRHTGAVILQKSMTLYLNNVCIKRLSMNNCDIAGISSTAFKLHGTLLQCLTHLDLSHNLLPFVSRGTIVKLLFGLRSLESFECYGQRGFTRGSDTHSHYPEEVGPPKDMTLFMNIPSSLRYVNMSGGVKDLSQVPARVVFPHGGNLSALDISFCGMMGCNFTVLGITNIRTLDISGNDCYTMGEQVFQHVSTLRRLKLADVFLQESFLFAHGTRMLKPLGELEELDLSSNQMRRLPADLLQYQPHLKSLSLARNHFEVLPSAITPLKVLQDIDLRDNMIHILSSSDRQILNNLAAHHTTTLHLRGNPLSCSCQALDMVNWLAITTVRLDGDNKNEGYDEDYDDNGRDYPCVLENGSMSSTWLVITQWESHWRHCVGQSIFTASIQALLLQLLALLLTYLLWSNWTYVKHMWYVLRHVRLPRRADFDYDALLVYASDDIALANKMKQCMLRVWPGLRVALPEDEILLGTFYPKEIAECMEQSWKIILLVTQDFMEDDMSGYTVLHAQSCLSDTMPRRVFLLYLGHLTAGHRPGPTHLSMRKLLRMLPENNVYHVPDNVTDDPAHPVWQSLVQAVTEQ